MTQTYAEASEIVREARYPAYVCRDTHPSFLLSLRRSEHVTYVTTGKVKGGIEPRDSVGLSGQRRRRRHDPVPVREPPRI